MNLLLVGCGNIGTTLLDKWVPLQAVDQIMVVQPSMSHAKDYRRRHNVFFINSLAEVPQTYKEDITILAFKPQNLTEVLPVLRERQSKLIISLLAGVMIEQLAAGLTHYGNIIRIMPNIALKTGRSVNLAFAQNPPPEEELDRISSIFAITGMITWLQSEKDIDILTPITGCGPAYFLLLAQTLFSETINLGIGSDIAKQVVQETLIGTASLIANKPDYNTLINTITSKGGVTEAALEVMRPNMQQTVQQALQAALKRIRELAK